MNETPSWTTRVEDYLGYRRNLGFALTNDAYDLRKFAKYAEQIEQMDPLTTAVAVNWALSVEHKSANTLARRIEKLRGFFRYCKRFDSATEIPPAGILGNAHRRLTPHIFAEEEVAALLAATDYLRPPDGLRPATCRTIFGLLATTGLRISEAVNLTKRDVDLSAELLTVREGKSHRQRLVPLHPTVAAELRAYARMRDKHVSDSLAEHFFLLDDGKPPSTRTINAALKYLCKKLGWRPRGDHLYHRLHDLRHTFVVNSLLRFYEKGCDVQQMVPLLTTYVGHAKFAHTYWYVTGVPELMGIAAQRFHAYLTEDAE